MPDKIATFAAGCFWGVEAKLLKIPGVLDTVVGYTGGKVENPSYAMVCSNITGHAEAVQVTYDPDKITFEELVKKFFELHDPTTLNQQGFDIGNQYRSAIFFHDEVQNQTAEKIKADLDDSGKYINPIATEIVRASIFYMAEDSHQRYFAKHNFFRQ